jgi:hypothetical protein
MMMKTNSLSMLRLSSVIRRRELPAVFGAGDGEHRAGEDRDRAAR